MTIVAYLNAGMFFALGLSAIQIINKDITMKRMSRSGIGTTAGFGLGAFSRDELDSIHYATLQIFQDTGIKVMNEEALEIFHGGGWPCHPWA